MKYGPRMTPTSNGDNVILTHQRSIYTLKMKGLTYKWEKLPNQLSIERIYHVQLLVPASTIQCKGMLPLLKIPISIENNKALTIANLQVSTFF